jgi:hypothetical protein
MFLSVEWAKRWLPAIFLLLSLFLPWWMLWERGYSHFSLSFPWNEDVYLFTYIGRHYVNYSPAGQYLSSSVGFSVSFFHLPVFCFVSALIFVSGLFGLSVRSKIRTLAGLLGIAGIISYFALILPVSLVWFSWRPFSEQVSNFPYFGFAIHERYGFVSWFLSIGFYFALAGSLMLLLPLIRTLIERLRDGYARISL